MNSLEFIEKQIEKEQVIIKTYKEYFKTDKTKFDKQITKGYIQVHQKNIDKLKQMKFELEAWEVVKNKGVDMLIFMLYYDNLEKYNNYIKSLEGECNYEKCLLTQEEANSIKKALEMTND